MARGYSSARYQVAEREDSFGDARRRKDYSSFDDQRLAEKAIRPEKVIDQPAAGDVERPHQLRERCLGGRSMTSLAGPDFHARPQRQKSASFLRTTAVDRESSACGKKAGPCGGPRGHERS
jgi:hypothetical protein